jgi:hypothetical protein
MPRPRAALRRARAAVLAAALGGLLATLAGIGPVPASAAKRAAERTPLTVTIDALGPTALRPRQGGRVTVRGTVTNTDDQPWLDVRLYPFASSTPMTTTTELAEAARSEETVEVGGRIVQDKVVIGDLQPGQTVGYTLIVPRDDLPRDNVGVYWFGVHALGSGPDGDDLLADGRARTFLPILANGIPPVRAAVLVPLRVHLQRNPDGSVAALDSWQRLLAPTGRLGRARTAGTSTGGSSLSWLVDPAVLDTVRQLAAGNPPRSLAPTAEPDDGQDGDTTTDSASPTSTPSASAGPKPVPDAQTEAVAALATEWLAAMVPVLQQSEVLALPYGDLDLPAAATHDPEIYGTARTRSIALLEQLGIPATQVNAPANGVVSADAVTMTDSATPMLLSDAALPDELAPGRPTPPVVAAGQWRLALSSTDAGAGGPAPGDPHADVALRQRILAEAALRALEPARPPLVVTLPARWRAADPAGFVTGLSQPWLQVTGLTAVMAGQVPTAVSLESLHYPASAARQELTGARFADAESLIRSGRTLQRVLARNDTVAAEVVGEALTGIGYAARASVGGGAASRSWIETKLGSIRVEGPTGITLSGSSGQFPATVVNGLDQPITVAIHAISDPGITITAPKSVQVAASSRITVLLDAGQAAAGLHNVRLQLVDSDGVQLGGSAYVPVRAAQVSKIIWLFLAIGGALLFGAIAVRLVRRVRASQAGGPGGPGGPGEPGGADAPDAPDAADQQVRTGE